MVLAITYMHIHYIAMALLRTYSKQQVQPVLLHDITSQISNY